MESEVLSAGLWPSRSAPGANQRRWRKYAAYLTDAPHMQDAKTMIESAPNPLDRESASSFRVLGDQAFSRAAGAPLVPGNKIRILRNAHENYPAWLEAMRSATRTIHFESYIIHADEVGYQFAELLAKKARQGVRVRLIYDWVGALGNTSWGFWRRLRKAGVEVRCFNPPRLYSPFGWITRDHRKMIAVDGRIGFVTGLCVGARWVGNPARRIEPWRDTGVAIEGPAVADIEQSFARMWASLGPPVPAQDLPRSGGSLSPAGDVTLRIVASEPNTAGLYRLDQLIAAVARNSIWLTDAYFLATPGYTQALRAAALDGVDVRLLLPRTSDIPVVRSMSRVGYRSLLEAGVRIFEWNGSMLHAKTGVADGRWARVGSTNLNVTSWMENYELDVVVEDEPFARAMEDVYLEDLAHSTEIVLRAKRKVRRAEEPEQRLPRRGSARGSAGRAATGMIAFGSTIGAAMTNREVLGPAEAPIMFTAALVLLALTAIAVLAPFLVSILIGVLGGWIAVTLLIKAFRLRFGQKE
jgi:cardiolipin synthase